MREDSFTPDKKAIKEMKKLRRKKEEFLFLSLCSESDYNQLKKKAKITLNDFERITYLARRLGFSYYCTDFENQHPDLMKKLGSQIEDEILRNFVDVEAELKKQKRWEDEFLVGISNNRMKSCLKKLLQLPNT